jgi:hypothetical protein
VPFNQIDGNIAENFKKPKVSELKARAYSAISTQRRQLVPMLNDLIKNHRRNYSEDEEGYLNDVYHAYCTVLKGPGTDQELCTEFNTTFFNPSSSR